MFDVAPLHPHARVAARGLVAAVACAALGAGLLPQAAASSASRERVRETGRVVAVADGDTVWVDVAGDGTSRPKLVRMAGIQATETKHKNMPNSKNWCHGVPAKQALTQLARGKRVQLRAINENSRAGSRLLRKVFVRSQGRWVDAQRRLLAAGKVMNETFMRETGNNALYGRLAQRAATRGVGMWRPAACGYGPQQTVPLRTWVKWDAEGPDESNLNDEYVVIENRSTTETLSLRGWMLRDTTHALFRFPSWASIAPDSFVRVRVGSGTHTATDFFWGLTNPLFQNTDKYQHSDFAILMDPQGDFRSWASYPCRWACGDPLKDKVEITNIQWQGPNDQEFVNGEHIVLANRTSADVRLSGYYVLVNGWLQHTFSPNRVLRAGDTLTLRMGRGEADQSTVYLGQAISRLYKAGGVVEVRNWNGTRLTCATWGPKTC